MKNQQNHFSIDIKSTALPATQTLMAYNSQGNAKQIELVEEQPLTIYLNRKEIVTVMTMGAFPAYLVIGFLLNQQLIEKVSDVASVHVDWDTQAAAVTTNHQVSENQQLEKKSRVVTSGCGQGTMFGHVMSSISTAGKNINAIQLSTIQIQSLLNQLTAENEVYKKAGGVHTCALCSKEKIIKSIEDVGRHNALDSLTGYLALEAAKGHLSEADQPNIMYTTGRLTSEMVIKTAQMGIPLIISRSGATAMGVAVAQQAGITLISRAKSKHFLVLNGVENIIFSD